MSQARTRLLALDVLRLLAIALVLGRHLSAPQVLPWGWMAIISTWRRGGWVGVDLFFVLSGFLVSGLLFAEYRSLGRFSIGRFYMRRGLRIYPPFLTLIATTIVIRLISGRGIAPPQAASELLFFQSYLPGLWIHTWSLGVEEHFYLLLPLVLAFALRRNRGGQIPLRAVIASATLVAVFVLVLRLVNWYVRPSYSNLTHVFPSHLRMDSLFFGVAIAYVYHFHHALFVEALTPWRRWLMLGGALLLTPAFAFQPEATPFIFTVGLSLFYLGSGMLLSGAILCQVPRSRFVIVLATLGTYSYSIYLWHMPVASWGIRLVELAWGRPLGFGAQAAVYLIGSLAVGVLMGKAVEIPVMRLRDSWLPRLASSVATPTAERQPSRCAPTVELS